MCQLEPQSKRKKLGKDDVFVQGPAVLPAGGITLVSCHSLLWPKRAFVRQQKTFNVCYVSYQYCHSNKFHYVGLC